MEEVDLCKEVAKLTSAYISNSSNPRKHMEHLVSIVSVTDIFPLRLRLLFLPLREAQTLIAYLNFGNILTKCEVVLTACSIGRA